MTAADGLRGRRILVVEDEYFIAEDLVRTLEGHGAVVLGPAAAVDDALDIIEEVSHLDAALVDINLQGEMAFAVADALLGRGVPFVFTTGYDLAIIPVRYSAVVRCAKPVTAHQIARALFGEGP